MPAPVPDAAVVNPSGIKTLCANRWSTCFNNGKLTFVNGPRRLQIKPPGCIILDSRIFEHFLLADDLFSKTLQRLVSCLSVSEEN